MIPVDDLKPYAFFRDFSDADCERISVIAEEEVFEAGAQLYKKGDPASYLYLVKEGKIVLMMDSHMGTLRPPLQVTIDFLTQGNAMGWSAVVAPFIYTLGALCIDRSTVIAIDAAKLRDMMDADGPLGFKIMQQITKLIADRLNHTRIVLVGERGLSHLTDY